MNEAEQERAGEDWRRLVRGHLARRGLEQKQLAGRLDRSRSYTSRLLSGRDLGQYSFNAVLELASALQLDALERDALVLAAAGQVEDDALGAYRKLLTNLSYIRNTQSYREEKEAIAREIVTNELLLGGGAGHIVFLDSGSTSTAIARSIAARHIPGDYYTNNFVVAFLLAANGIPSHLLGGNVDLSGAFEAFTALLGDMTVKALEGIPLLTTTVVSSTALTFRHGPHSRAVDNSKFKLQLIHKAIKDGRQLIFAADFSKFLHRSHLDWAICQDDGLWHAVMTNDETYIVTAGRPTTPRELSRFNEAIEPFRQVMRDRFIVSESPLPALPR